MRAWRWWYNARGIVETQNRLQARATAVLMVHPWGLDDGHGLPTPEPAGCAFFCTREKNLAVAGHLTEVVNPFLDRLRGRAALVAYSLPGVEDPIRQLLYASVRTRPEDLDAGEGERRLADLLAAHDFHAAPLVESLDLDPLRPVPSYLAATPATDAHGGYNGPGYWELPMPVHSAVRRDPSDLVFYDGEGYPIVRDYLRGRGVRHVLLLGTPQICVYAPRPVGIGTSARTSTSSWSATRPRRPTRRVPHRGSPRRWPWRTPP